MKTNNVDSLGWTDRPKITEDGQDEIPETKENGLCCAEVKNAKTIKVSGESVVPNNDSTGPYNNRGAVIVIDLGSGVRRFVVGHEGRRVQVYRKGYNEYIKKAQQDAYTKKCGKICHKTPGKAKELLQNYLVSLRADANSQYKTYYEAQQKKIDGENQFVSVANGTKKVVINRQIYEVPLIITNLGNSKAVKVDKPTKFVPPDCKKE